MNVKSPERPSSSSDVARLFQSRFLTLLLVASAALAPSCKPHEFTPDASPAQSLREYDRIEIRPLSTTGTQMNGVPEDLKDRLPTFAATFPAELRPRVYRKHILNASTGRLLILEGTITRYELTGNLNLPPSETPAIVGKIEIEMKFSDENGKRIVGGKASASSDAHSGLQALDLVEKRAAAAVADYLRRAVKGGAKAAPNASDDP
jgi:hypothetical protein